jgi:hypothetical protein
MLSPGAALPDPVTDEQLLFAAVTLHEASVLSDVLSMTATVASSPVRVVFVSAYGLVTVAPLAGMGPTSWLLLETPLVLAGHDHLPCPASSV